MGISSALEPHIIRSYIMHSDNGLRSICVLLVSCSMWACDATFPHALISKTASTESEILDPKFGTLGRGLSEEQRYIEASSAMGCALLTGVEHEKIITKTTQIQHRYGFTEPEWQQTAHRYGPQAISNIQTRMSLRCGFPKP